MLVTWNGSTGLTYHVYRRAASSSGSFFRIDNPLGNLAAIGVADTFFVDKNVDGISSYTYMVIAQTAGGVYSPHSASVTASSATPFAPTLASVSPTSGVANGGTLVNLYGTGFDSAGVTVSFGASPATSIAVLSPQHITARTPAGTGTVNVSVVNIASSLSATLTAAFSYFGNTPPVANAGPDQLGRFKNTTITLDGSASSDVNLDPLVYHWRRISGPAAVTLSDSNVVQPTFTATANGDYIFELKVSDPYSISNPDSVLIRVIERAPVLAAIGPKSVNEGAVLAFSTSATDPDLTTPTLTAIGLPLNATYTDNLNGTGSFSFSPNFTQAGVYNVTFIASDGVLADSEIVAITVNNVNRAPVLAAIGPKSVNEGAVLAFSTSATDPDLTTPTMTAVGLPLNATYTDNLNGTGSFSFSPNFTQAGVYNVTFIASDGVLADSEVVAITVNNVNRAPVLAAIGPRSVNEGAVLSFGTSATDPDLTTPTMTAVGLPLNATYTDNLNGTGSFSFSPNFTQAGVYNVTFIASDGLLADSEVVAITVNNVNQAPVLATIGPRSVPEGSTLSFGTSASDPDLTIPTLTAVGLPLNATYVDNLNGTGTFQLQPDFTQAGLYNVTFIASDGLLADSEVVAITVTGTNLPPVLAAIGPKSVNEGAILNFRTSATDPDLTTPILTAVGLPPNATYVDHLNGTATFNFTPNFTQAGVINVTFIASDGFLADSEVVAITVNNVNQAPVLATIGPRSVPEGSTLNFGTSASDPDLTTPTMTAVGLPLNATYVDNLNGTGSFSFSPDYTQAGLYNVTFIASDGLLADSEVVAITVTGTNLPPVLAAIGPKSVNEGAVLNFGTSASDPDLTTPTMTAVGLPPNATYTDNLNGTATFSFAPNFTQAGVINVTFIASDGFLADSEVVAITVNNVNQAPVLATIGPRSVPEGSTLSFGTSASDPDLTIPTLTAVGLPLNATYVDHLNGTGTFSFSPSFTQAGLYNVTFIASDGVLADSEVVVITVTESNLPPVLAAIGPKSVNEGAVLNFSTSASDPDLTTPIMTAVGLPPNATYVDHLNGTATFNFAPSFAQSGVINVTFIASDGFLADSEVVAITVIEAGNQAPVLATIGPRSVNEGANLTFGTSASDPDLTTPAMTAINLPVNATYVDNANGTGTFNFNPDFTQAGVFNVTFIASDGLLADSEVVTITVVNTDRAPVLATIGPRSVNAGSNLTFGTSAIDPDGTIPSMTAVNLPAHATYIDNVNGTGTFIFVPDLSQSGVYNVTFIASDGILADSEIVPITVINSSNQPPVLDSIGPKIVYEGGVLAFQIHATDDAGIPSLIVDAPTLNGQFTFVDGGNGYGTFTYSPDYYSAGIDTVIFFALDSGGSSDFEKVQITTLDVNRPPHISRMTDYTLLPGDSLKIHVIATDSTDPNGGALFLISMAKPTGSVFTDSTGGRGSLRWKPTIADTGTYNFIVLCMDDEVPSLSDVDTARITVQKTNQAPVLATIGAKSIPEGDSLFIHLSATDPDGTIPFFYAENIPTNASLVDSGNGRALFSFRPTFTQSGLYSVKFFASDGNKVDYEVVLIQVVNVPQPPTLTVPVDTQFVREGDSLQFHVYATDPDGTNDTLKVDPTTKPVNATFVDSLNGGGLFKFKPNFIQSGVYNVRFFATDGVRSDTAIVVILVREAGNQRPKITATPASVTVTELDVINIKITATDPDSSIPILTTTTPLPFTATFVDSLNGHGRFNWVTAQQQNNTYSITFYATDRDTTGVIDSVVVPIIVQDLIALPATILYEPPSICGSPGSGTCWRQMNEGEQFTFRIAASQPDPDGDHPIFRCRRYTATPTDTTFLPLPANLTFTDNRVDNADFDFRPDFNQAGEYRFMFFMMDVRDTTFYLSYLFRVVVQNQFTPPVLSPIGPLSVLEGGSLDINVTGTDPDGGAVTLTATGLPPGATFSLLPGQPAGTAKGRFLYGPGFSAAGTYTTTFKVVENTPQYQSDSEVVTITVIDAGNQKPVLIKLDTLRMVNVTNDAATFWLRSADPDGTIPTLSVVGTPYVPYNAVFRDSGTGRGSFVFDPTNLQVDSSFVFRFIASDGLLADTSTTRVVVVTAMRGDANNDKSIDVSDVVYLINYIFASGPAPASTRNGDADGSNSIDISDGVYLVQYIFGNGPPPPPL